MHEILYIHQGYWLTELSRMPRTKNFRITLGSILVAVYVFLSFFTLFVAFGVRMEANRELYSKFQNSINEEILKLLPIFRWGKDINFDHIGGISLGMMGVVPALFSLFILAKIRVDIGKNGIEEKQQDNRIVMASTSIFLIYLISVFLTLYLGNQLLVVPLSETALTFTFSAISCLASYIYLFRISRKHLREKDFTSVTDKWECNLQLKHFELEHSKFTQILYLSVSVFFGLVVGIFFVQYYGHFVTFPPIIAYSFPFRGLIFSVFSWAVVLIVGYFLGVISQIMWILGDVIDSLGEYKKFISTKM